MAFKAVKRPSNRSEVSVYSRGGAKICKFFQQDKCTRIDCRFLHVLASTPFPYRRASEEEKTLTRRDNNINRIVKQKVMLTPKRMPISTKTNIATSKSIAPQKTILSKQSIVTKINIATHESIATEKSMPSRQSVVSKNTVPTQGAMVTQNIMPSLQSLVTKNTIATQKSIGTQQSIQTQKSIVTQKNNAILKPLEKVCNFWANAKCMKGDKCPHLHSWFRGDGFSMLAKLQDHNKMVTGIVLPEGSSKLYSASKDGTVRVWDCHTGLCGSVINLGGEAGCLFSKGPWVFAGAPNVVEAWNIHTNAGFSLSAPAGQVHAMEVGNEMLFAGTQESVILVWKDGPKDNPFQLAAPLEGHTGAVVCLKVEANRLYSGSADHTIRAWDLNTLQCVMTLNAHSDVVTSLICWGQFLISCSLDRTIKVWAGKGNLEATYTHTQEHGILGLSGMADAESKPVLLSSCKDNSVWLYELPSFAERGRLFAKEEVGAIQVGPGGLFFSGDGTGLLSVWKWVD